MDYKRLKSAPVYTLEVDAQSESNVPTNQPRPNLQSPRVLRHFNRLPFIGKCSLKWFAIWTLCFLTFMNSMIPYYRRFTIKPFTYPDDTSIFVTPRFTFDGKASKSIEMLIVVNSDADDRKQRDLIRKNWASPKNRKPSTKILFLVGLSENTDLENEKTFHQDIITASIIEDYYNLPLKTLVMLQFTDKFFPQVDCLVKADSDNYLNISNLEDLCVSLRGQELITGHCEDKTRVIRDWYNKWHVPKFVYASDKWPLYCFGETYLFIGRKVRGKLLSKLGEYGFDSSRNRRLLPEDAIFSGFLAEMADIRRQNTNGFALQKETTTFDCVDGRAKAYTYHLINDKTNFAKAIYYMSKADQFNCTTLGSRN